jgi:hypothetical protein
VQLGQGEPSAGSTRPHEGQTGVSGSDAVHSILGVTPPTG